MKCCLETNFLGEKTLRDNKPSEFSLKVTSIEQYERLQALLCTTSV